MDDPERELLPPVAAVKLVDAEVDIRLAKGNVSTICRLFSYRPRVGKRSELVKEPKKKRQGKNYLR